MNTASTDSLILQRALDLCQAVADQPDFHAMKDKIDAFMGDELLKFQYQQLNDLGQLLQMKQADGLELKPEEIAQFEETRGTFLGNPVAQGFLEAREQMQQLHQTVGRLLDLTFELGRRPQSEDLQDGSCGSGCGCQ